MVSITQMFTIKWGAVSAPARKNPKRRLFGQPLENNAMFETLPFRVGAYPNKLYTK